MRRLHLIKAMEMRFGGKVEWDDGMLPVPDSYELVKVLAVTL